MRLIAGAGAPRSRRALPRRAVRAKGAHDPSRPRRRRHRNSRRNCQSPPPGGGCAEGLGARPSLRRFRRPLWDRQPRVRRAAPPKLLGVDHGRGQRSGEDFGRVERGSRARRGGDRGAVFRRALRPGRAHRLRARKTRKWESCGRACAHRRRFSRVARAGVRRKLRRRRSRRGQGARRARARRPARQHPQGVARQGACGAKTPRRRAYPIFAGRAENPTEGPTGAAPR